MPNVLIKGYKILRTVRVGQDFSLAEVEHKQSGIPDCLCGSHRLIHYDSYRRYIKHVSENGAIYHLKVKCKRYKCLDCGRVFRERLEGVRPYARHSERFKNRLVSEYARNVCNKAIARIYRISASTVERAIHSRYEQKLKEQINYPCPEIIGIDEHTIHKGYKFATTIADLSHHRVYDVIKGKRHSDIESTLMSYKGRENVKVVCMDLSSGYRSIVRRCFPRAKIVADRFHVIRLVLHHFMEFCKSAQEEVKWKRSLTYPLRKRKERLKPHERERIKGILINKFRGDIRLFESGITMLEELCGIPVVGVVPYYRDIYIEEEDSVALAAKSVRAEKGKVNIAVILLRHLSNFTDFNVLERDPRVHLFYTNNVDELAKADVILLPGSKSTLDDLYELRRNGVAAAIIRAHREGATVMGICGGYQMMGQEVLDPEHVEGDIERLPGLGLLPISTRMSGEKVTRQVKFGLCNPHSPSSTLHSPLMQGYEIHMGVTTPVEGTPDSPLNLLENGSTDGYYVDSTCMGTYIHGILDNPEFIDFLLVPFADKLSGNAGAFDYHTFKEEQYDRLAEHVRRHVNLPLIYQILTKNHD